ncbi:MAG TPA: Imm70 family immunity protein [Xanthomonadaceae bacterium]|nr:Imm70 family immunity protein [Xanthomonadaceae bacterium]
MFDGEEEVDGVQVGHYSDFNTLRDYIVGELERGQAGTRFPTFVMHADCDGEWSTSDCGKLRIELAEIVSAMKLRPPVSMTSDWQKQVAKFAGLVPQSAFESFIDVNAEFVLERIQCLVDTALERHLPVLFQ